MATGTRQSNTMEEVLRKLLPQTTDLLLTDDVDPDFVAQLQAGIVQKLREPQDQALAAQQALQQTQVPQGMATTQVPQMQGPSAPMPSGGMPMPAPPPGPMRATGGAMAGVSGPSGDEISRILASLPGPTAQ